MRQLVNHRKVRLERPLCEFFKLQLPQKWNDVAPVLDRLLLDAERPRQSRLGFEMSDCVFLAHDAEYKAYLTAKSTGIPDGGKRTMQRVPAIKTRTSTKTGFRRQPRVATTKLRPDAGAPDHKTVGGRLVICREAAKLKQAPAAKRIGITPQSLGELERGESKSPSAQTLLDMRDKVGYDPDYVIRGKGMPLLPNFEELAKEMALISIFRELRPKTRESLFDIAQGLRRAQGDGPSLNDPFERGPPKDKGDDD